MGDIESSYSVLFVCNRCGYFWVSSFLFDNAVRCVDCGSADVGLYPIGFQCDKLDGVLNADVCV
jgi:hypothetical protein